MLKRHHHCENNELSELSVLRYKEHVYAFVETLMPHAIQIRQTGGPEVLNWTPIEVGEPGSGQVRLRQAAAGLNYIDVYHRTGYYSQPLPFIPGLEGAGTVEAIGQDVRGVKVGDRVAYAGPAGGYSEVRLIEADRLVRLPDAISFDQAAAMMLQGMTAQVLIRQVYPVKGSLFLTRPLCSSTTSRDEKSLKLPLTSCSMWWLRERCALTSISVLRSRMPLTPTRPWKRAPPPAPPS